MTEIWIMSTLFRNLFYNKSVFTQMDNNSSITLSLWFDNNAEEALKHYASIFPDSYMSNVNPVVASVNLSGVNFIGINGGPIFQINPSISMMVICESEEEIDTLWHQLLPGGAVLMALDSYPWSHRYGWLQDKYNVNWQLYLGKLSDVHNQKIVPTMMFCGSQQGQCKKALAFYQSVFADYRSDGILKYPNGEMTGQIQHTQFVAHHSLFMAMDSGVPQDFTFNEGVSFVIHCKDQEEIDYYWNKFTEQGKESMCGWCKDPFGVSWQVVPDNIDKLISSPSANQALMKMKKIIIADLN